MYRSKLLFLCPLLVFPKYLLAISDNVLASSINSNFVAAGISSNSNNKQDKQIFEEQSIETFSISDLQRLSSITDSSFSTANNVNNDRIMKGFREALSTTGLIAVSLDDDENDDAREKGSRNSSYRYNTYSRDRSVALDGLCSCIDHPEFLKLDQTHDFIFPKSTTQRTSVATATVGLDHPLPLPDGLEETCGVDVVLAMDGLRDVVATVSKAFVAALDANIGSSSTSSSSTKLLRDKQRGKSYNSVTDIVSAANHLEHFHVYTNNNDNAKKDDYKRRNENEKDRNSNSNDDFNVAWDWHTDAGMFLVFVPAWDCNNNLNGNSNDNTDESFYYRDGRTGTPTRAKFDGGRTAIVMLGQGAEDWLNLPTSSSDPNKEQSLLKATSHSVRWAETSSPVQIQQTQSQPRPQRRAWYGMMHLVPETAMIYGAKTLREVKESLSLSHQSKNDYQPSPSLLLSSSTRSRSSLSLGCGDVFPSFSSQLEKDEENYYNSQIVTTRRRRLETKDPSMCNNVTNFFCWMTCMDIPEADEAEHYVNNGYSLYCVDESILDQTGNVSAAHDQCIDIHNKACVGSWELTVDDVPSAEIDITTDASEIEHPFCYGGTSMYMEGFQWIQSSTCVILLFPSWVLDSAWKYTLAVIGTFLFAIGLEKFIQERRKIMLHISLHMESSINRLLTSALLYGVQVSLGYLLMLIIMIYSGILFLAVILGLITGHILFNAKDAVWPIIESPNNSLGDTNTAAFDNNSDDASSDENKNINSNVKDSSSKGVERRRCSNTSSSSSTKVEMNLLKSGAPGERALEEGSTHCQEFDNNEHYNEYYGSLDEEKKDKKANKVGSSVNVIAAQATTTNKNKDQNKTTNKKRVDHGVPEGSTPCCQHGM